MGRVDTAEIRDTVVRMESRLGAEEDSNVRQLMEAYRELVPRFAADLQDERDELMCRGGALMLVQAK